MKKLRLAAPAVATVLFLSLSGAALAQPTQPPRAPTVQQPPRAPAVQQAPRAPAVQQAPRAPAAAPARTGGLDPATTAGLLASLGSAAMGGSVLLRRRIQQA